MALGRRDGSCSRAEEYDEDVRLIAGITKFVDCGDVGVLGPAEDSSEVSSKDWQRKRDNVRFRLLTVAPAGKKQRRADEAE